MTSLKKLQMGSIFALALALGACGDDSGDSTDDKGDTGTTSPKDAATDSSQGGGLDATVDAAGPKADASTPADSSTVVEDASVADSSVADSGKDAAVVDAGGGDTIPTLNDCAPADYMDLSASGATRTVAFGSNLKYTPKCITIAAGQTVTFNGSFSAHPLAKGTASSATAGTAGSPIVDTSTGQTKEITFPTAGTYPYHCTIHAGAGMVGSIHVK